MKRDHETRGLFDEPDGRLEFPRARASDPVQSHEAADRVTADGIAHGQRAALLTKVRELPGATASELGRALGHPGNHIACRRLPELEAKTLVRRGAPRKCTVTGFKAATWWRS